MAPPLPACTPRAGGDPAGDDAGQPLEARVATTITAITAAPSTLHTASLPSNSKGKGKKGRLRRRASAPDIAQLLPTVGLDDFELQFKLGEGGGGTVWQCKTKEGGHVYAIKIVEKSSIVS